MLHFTFHLCHFCELILLYAVDLLRYIQRIAVAPQFVAERCHLTCEDILLLLQEFLAVQQFFMLFEAVNRLFCPLIPAQDDSNPQACHPALTEA